MRTQRSPLADAVVSARAPSRTYALSTAGALSMACALSTAGALSMACAADVAVLPDVGPSAADASSSAADASAADASSGAADAAGAADASSGAADASGADAGVITSSASITMNEASILFPLPPAAAVDGLLRADAAGVGGPLVPRALYDRTTPLVLAGSPDEVWARLRVVALRVDGCPQRLTDQICAPRIRLVLQPITVNGAEAFADDAALHAIYAVSVDELNAVVDGLIALRAGAPELTRDRPLGVHPVMAREGLDGPYARGVRTLITAHVGEARLVRLTFMQLSGRANVWVWGGFDRAADGTVTPLGIRGVAQATQRIVHNIFTDELELSVEPSVVDRDDFSLLYRSAASSAATAAARATALDAALRVEHPDRHDADSVDCARCHVAFVARRWTERVLGDDTSRSPERFTAPGYPLEVLERVAPPAAQRTFRAFGWQGRDPAINARTVNETAVVVRELAR